MSTESGHQRRMSPRPGPLVLVVEDDESITGVIRPALEDEGYRVLTAVGGGALPLAHAQQPDVILLDLHMPLMDGAEVCRRLRADPATAHIPIIVMSASRHLTAITAHLPIDDHMAKPFDLDDLLRAVTRWTAAA